MQPQNQTPTNQQVPDLSLSPAPVTPPAPVEPPAPAPSPAPATPSAPVEPPAPAPSPAPVTPSNPVAANENQQLPTVTPSNSPLATPPNIPPSQLKEYLANQANTQQSNPEQSISGGSSSFELMIVSLQFVMLAIILLDFFSPLLIRSTTAMVIGALFIGLGLALAIWSRASFKQHMKIFPSPSEKGFLVTGGPYSLMRHPVYTGVLTASLGLVLIYPSVLKVIAYIALVFIMMAKIKYEEKMLAKKYSGYSIYQQHTGKLLPKLSKN